MQCLPHGASWMDANRGPGGWDPDHQAVLLQYNGPTHAKTLRSAVSQPLRGFRRPSSSLPKTDPVKSKITRFEAALKVLGQEQSEARACLEEALKKAKTESDFGQSRFGHRGFAPPLLANLFGSGVSWRGPKGGAQTRKK